MSKPSKPWFYAFGRLGPIRGFHVPANFKGVLFLVGAIAGSFALGRFASDAAEAGRSELAGLFNGALVAWCIASILIAIGKTERL